jgi:hypothetical protein
VPRAPLPEVWEHSFGHDDDTKKIRLDLSPKVREGGVFHGAYIAVAGVVDEHIHDAKRLNCCIDSVLGLRFVRNIQRKSSRPVTVPADNIVELEGIAKPWRRRDGQLRGQLARVMSQVFEPVTCMLNYR